MRLMKVRVFVNFPENKAAYKILGQRNSKALETKIIFFFFQNVTLDGRNWSTKTEIHKYTKKKK